MNNVEDTIEVPILEVNFENFLRICEKINIVDSITLYSMPNHVKEYATSEKFPIADLMNLLIEYQKPENEWRRKEDKVVDLQNNGEYIQIGEKTIFDAERIIIISKMNSAFIIPGEKTLKEGKFLPNEIIKMTNLISSQLFLLNFVDEPAEDNSSYNLKVEYSIINKKANEN